MAAIVHAQARLRDRFLFALLALTGMRVGQALGLRHADVVSHERRIELVARTDNANGARGKGSAGSVPITSALVRLHSDYMHDEYGDLDSDYVFVNLWGGRIGRPLTYATVDELVRGTRVRVGFFFTAHMLRHTFATLAARRGVPVAVLAKLLCHRSVQTTSDTYPARHRRGPARRARARGRARRPRSGTVTAAAAMVPAEHARSWTHVLLAEVRREFRAEVYVPEPGDSVLARDAATDAQLEREPAEGCVVRGCRRSVYLRRLCRSHGRRWKRAGEPELDRFAATAGPMQTRRGECVVGGCGFREAAGRGPCDAHERRFRGLLRADRDLAPAGYAARLATAGGGRGPRLTRAACRAGSRSSCSSRCSAATTRTPAR